MSRKGEPFPTVSRPLSRFCAFQPVRAAFSAHTPVCFHTSRLQKLHIWPRRVQPVKRKITAEIGRGSPSRHGVEGHPNLHTGYFLPTKRPETGPYTRTGPTHPPKSFSHTRENRLIYTRIKKHVRNGPTQAFKVPCIIKEFRIHCYYYFFADICTSNSPKKKVKPLHFQKIFLSL